MDFDTVDALRERHPAWRVLRGGNASLLLSFLGRFFVVDNRGATAASLVVAALDDELWRLNGDSGEGEPRFAQAAAAYVDDWSRPERGFLRRFYPPGDDEVHLEVTPAFEKAYAWVESLQGRAFVGTESRLHTVVELLRQIAHGTEVDADARLADLRRRRDELDAQIAAVEAGDVALMDSTGVRDRYQQASTTARELLSDFREVEANFRALDRQARERIAGWQGSKGELLAELVGGRADIATSDQGRSFDAFSDFLLSERRQDELATLLETAQRLEAVAEGGSDPRFRTVHHDWAEAAERTQRTVRQISEQLRRFLDEQVWLENRRVIDLVRDVEAAALAVRDAPPTGGLEIELPGVDLALPLDRPLHRARAAASVDSAVPDAEPGELEADLLFSQSFVDQARLADNVRALLPERSSALLEDIVALYPPEQGVAELVGYLALSEPDVEVELDDTEQTVVDLVGNDGTARRARLPRVTVRRR